MNALQGMGKIPVDVEKWNVGVMLLSGNLIYVPKGHDACRNSGIPFMVESEMRKLLIWHRPIVRFEPQMSGAGHTP